MANNNQGLPKLPETPKFPTQFTEQDAARLEDLGKLAAAQKDIYMSRFTPEVWGQTPFPERAARGVAALLYNPPQWFRNVTPWTEYGLTPEQADVYIRETETEIRELERVKQVSERAPTIKDYITSLALQGLLSGEEAQLYKFIPELSPRSPETLRLPLTDEERQWFIEYNTEIAGKSIEEVAQLYTGGFPAPEDIEDWMKSISVYPASQISPTQILSAVALSQDIDEIGRYLELAYPPQVENPEQAFQDVINENVNAELGEAGVTPSGDLVSDIEAAQQARLQEIADTGVPDTITIGIPGVNERVIAIQKKDDGIYFGGERVANIDQDGKVVPLSLAEEYELQESPSPSPPTNSSDKDKAYWLLRTKYTTLPTQAYTEFFAIGGTREEVEDWFFRYKCAVGQVKPYAEKWSPAERREYFDSPFISQEIDTLLDCYNLSLSLPVTSPTDYFTYMAEQLRYFYPLLTDKAILNFIESDGSTEAITQWYTVNTGITDVTLPWAEEDIWELKALHEQGSYPKTTLISQAWNSGVSSALTLFGGAAHLLGKDGFMNDMFQGAEALEKTMPQVASLADFKMTNLLDPRFWTTPQAMQLFLEGVRTLPLQVLLLPLTLLGWSAGSAVGGKVAGRLVTSTSKLGKFGSWIIQNLFAGAGSASLSRPMESITEAAESYDEALNRGFTPKEAEGVFNEVFWNNMKLAGLDMGEAIASLAPIPPTAKILANGIAKGLFTVARVGGRIVITGLEEGWEERYQLAIQRAAMGEEDPWRWDSEAQLAATLGGMMGIGMGGGGDILSNIINNTETYMTVEQKEIYDTLTAESIEELEAKGVEKAQAELTAARIALDDYASTPDGAELIADLTEVAKEDAYNAEITDPTKRVHTKRIEFLQTQLEKFDSAVRDYQNAYDAAVAEMETTTSPWNKADIQDRLIDLKKKIQTSQKIRDNITSELKKLRPLTAEERFIRALEGGVKEQEFWGTAARREVLGVTEQGTPMPAYVQQQKLEEAKTYLEEVEVKPNSLHTVPISEGEAIIFTDNEGNPLMAATAHVRDGVLTLDSIVSAEPHTEKSHKALDAVLKYVEENKIGFAPESEMSPDMLRVYKRYIGEVDWETVSTTTEEITAIESFGSFLEKRYHDWRERGLSFVEKAQEEYYKLYPPEKLSALEQAERVRAEKQWIDSLADYAETFDPANKLEERFKELWGKAEEITPKPPEVTKPVVEPTVTSEEIYSEGGIPIDPDEPIPTEVVDESPIIQDISIKERARPSRKIFEMLGLYRLYKTVQEAEVNMLEARIAFRQELLEMSKLVKKERRYLVFRELENPGTQELTTEEQQAVDFFKRHFDEWADRLGIPEEQRRENYITHIFEADMMAQYKEGHPPDPAILRALEYRAPKTVFMPYLQERLGATTGLIEDPFAAAWAYDSRALRVLYYEPLLQKIAVIANDTNTPPIVRRYFREYTRRMTSAPSKLDIETNNMFRGIAAKLEKLPGGKPFANLLTRGNFAGMVSYNLANIYYTLWMGLKPSSAIRNLSQNILTLCEVGAGNFAKGIALRATAEGKAAMEQSLAIRSRKGAYLPGIDEAFGSRWSQEFREIALSMFRAADRLNVSNAFLAGYAEAKALFPDAPQSLWIERGDEVAADTQYLYTQMNAMELGQSSMGRVLTVLATWGENFVELGIKWIKRSPSQAYLNYAKEQGKTLSEIMPKKNWSMTYKSALLYMAIVAFAFSLRDRKRLEAWQYTGITSLNYLADAISGELPGLEIPGAVANLVAGFLTQDDQRFNEGWSNMKKTFTPGIATQLLRIAHGERDWLTAFFYLQDPDEIFQTTQVVAKFMDEKRQQLGQSVEGKYYTLSSYRIDLMNKVEEEGVPIWQVDMEGSGFSNLDRFAYQCESLLAEYKDLPSSERVDYRITHPAVDAALYFWEQVSTLHSKNAKEILEQYFSSFDFLDEQGNIVRRVHWTALPEIPDWAKLLPE